MKGRLASDHTPYVTIEMLEAGVGREFVVDTGFSGYLYLPEDKIANWNLLFITSASMVLANQSVIIETCLKPLWSGSLLSIVFPSLPVLRAVTPCSEWSFSRAVGLILIRCLAKSASTSSDHLGQRLRLSSMTTIEPITQVDYHPHRRRNRRLNGLSPSAVRQ